MTRKPVKIEICSCRELDPDLPSTVIMWYQGEPFSHILVVVTYDDGFEEIFHSVERGVCREPLSPYLKDHVLPHRIQLKPQNYRTYSDVVAYMEGSLGIKYSKLSQFIGYALSFLRPRMRDGRARMKCSDFVVDVIRNGLRYTTDDIDEDFTTPKQALGLAATLEVMPTP